MVLFWVSGSQLRHDERSDPAGIRLDRLSHQCLSATTPALGHPHSSPSHVPHDSFFVDHLLVHYGLLHTRDLGGYPRLGFVRSFRNMDSAPEALIDHTTSAE